MQQPADGYLREVWAEREALRERCAERGMSAGALSRLPAAPRFERPLPPAVLAKRPEAAAKVAFGARLRGPDARFIAPCNVPGSRHLDGRHAEAVIAEIAAVFGCHPRHIKNGRKMPAYMAARKITFLILREVTGLPTSSIAGLLSLTDGSGCHLGKAAGELLRDNAHVRALYDQSMAAIRARWPGYGSGDPRP